MNKQEKIQVALAMGVAAQDLTEALIIQGYGNLGVMIAVYDDHNSVLGGTADIPYQPRLLRWLAERQESYNEDNPYEQKGYPGFRIATFKRAEDGKDFAENFMKKIAKEKGWRFKNE